MKLLLLIAAGGAVLAAGAVIVRWRGAGERWTEPYGGEPVDADGVAL